MLAKQAPTICLKPVPEQQREVAGDALDVHGAEIDDAGQVGSLKQEMISTGVSDAGLQVEDPERCPAQQIDKLRRDLPGTREQLSCQFASRIRLGSSDLVLQPIEVPAKESFDLCDPVSQAGTLPSARIGVGCQSEMKGR